MKWSSVSILFGVLMVTCVDALDDRRLGGHSDERLSPAVKIQMRSRSPSRVRGRTEVVPLRRASTERSGRYHRERNAQKTFTWKPTVPEVPKTTAKNTVFSSQLRQRTSAPRVITREDLLQKSTTAPQRNAERTVTGKPIVYDAPNTKAKKGIFLSQIHQSTAAPLVTTREGVLQNATTAPQAHYSTAGPRATTRESAKNTITLGPHTLSPQAAHEYEIAKEDEELAGETLATSPPPAQTPPHTRTRVQTQAQHNVGDPDLSLLVQPEDVPFGPP